MNPEFILNQLHRQRMALPKLKHLEWNIASTIDKAMYAATPFGELVVSLRDDKYVAGFTLGSRSGTIGKFDTLREAQSQAENHYKTMILSTLVLA